MTASLTKHTHTPPPRRREAGLSQAQRSPWQRKIQSCPPNPTCPLPLYLLPSLSPSLIFSPSLSSSVPPYFSSSFLPSLPHSLPLSEFIMHHFITGGSSHHRSPCQVLWLPNRSPVWPFYSPLQLAGASCTSLPKKGKLGRGEKRREEKELGHGGAQM